uniref:Sushi domain containing 1 n=1 Tax=Amphiprion ocellaris TaxID=80972 RepID=A0A3Q1CZM0_AMPOC
DSQGGWMKEPELVAVLSVLSGVPAEGQPLLDVCATCHANATCDNKSDGSGKVCNCKYGFVGNGRTFCQDKDECLIGAKLCGQHTTCHNTYGSYYCTCLAGYSPSNNMAVFIPNDGTHCQDIDECRITGLCGDGGQCRNIEGSFDCSCMVGYKIHNGAEPFHPMRDKASCKEILCGSPPLIESTEQVWNSNSTPGSTVLYFCKDGFYYNGGHNMSICDKNGLWTPPTLLCQEISCGPPLTLPHTNLLWDRSSTPGSVVMYECMDGFYQESGNNISSCSLSGEWGKVSVKCKGRGTVYVQYICTSIYSAVGASLYLSICMMFIHHSNYPALHSFINFSLPSPFRENSHSSMGYKLLDYITHSGQRNFKISGDGVVTLRLFIFFHNFTFEVLRHFLALLSLLHARCETHRHTTQRLEIKPPINHLFIFNENCLRWKAEKYEEDTEVYRVTYTGSRDYQKSFHDKRKRFLSSKDDQLELCLNLLPVTNYSISITATLARFTASITTNTSLPEFETPLPTLRLRRSPSTLDPISFYQVFVLPVEEIMMFDCSSPVSLDGSSKIKSPSEYITAQFDVQHVGTDMNFTVGDGLLYGGVYNTPLQSGNNYYIILRATSTAIFQEAYNCYFKFVLCLCRYSVICKL